MTCRNRPISMPSNIWHDSGRPRIGEGPSRVTWLLLFVVGVTACISADTRTLHAGKPPITDIAVAPDGNSLVTVSQIGIQIFKWPELQRTRAIPTASANLHCVAFAPQTGLLAVGGGDPGENGTVEIFSWPATERIAKFNGHQDSVRSIAWVNPTRLLSASIDRDVKLWNVAKPADSAPITTSLATFRGHSRSVDAICLLETHNTLVSAGVDQSLRVWDLKTGKLVRSLNQHTKPIHALALRPSGSELPLVASTAGDRTIRFWQPTIGRMVRYVRLDVEALDIAWVRDGSHIVATCVDGQVRVVDADEVRVVQTLPAVQGWAYTIAVHPSDGSLIVGGSNGQLVRVVPSLR